jgi:hypothetical protein
MQEEEVAKVMWFILNKLNTMDKWGGSHTASRNLFKGLPIKYIASAQGKKIAQEALKELINNQFILAKPSAGEVHVSLNSHKAAEIKEFIQRSR